MIKPSKQPQRAKGKPYNRPSPVGNAPLLLTTPLHGKASHVIFRSLSLPYKSRSLATPEGEVLAALYFVVLMREMLLCDLLCPRLRGKGGAVRHQRGRAAFASSFLGKEAKHYRTASPLSFRAERSGGEKSPCTKVPVVSRRYVARHTANLLSEV